jgi:hypothetical protein
MIHLLCYVEPLWVGILAYAGRLPPWSKMSQIRGIYWQRYVPNTNGWFYSISVCARIRAWHIAKSETCPLLRAEASLDLCLSMFVRCENIGGLWKNELHTSSSRSAGGVRSL